MILLTRLSGSEFVVNSDLIERIDKTPDTVITLTDGSKYVVRESLRAVVAEIRLHRAEVIALSEHVQVHRSIEEAEQAELARLGLLEDGRPALASVSPHPSLVGAAPSSPLSERSH